MVERFLKLYEAYHYIKPSLRMELTNNNNEDWWLTVYHADSETVIFDENDTSLHLLCARAYIALVEWASNFENLEDVEANLK